MGEKMTPMSSAKDATTTGTIAAVAPSSPPHATASPSSSSSSNNSSSHNNTTAASMTTTGAADHHPSTSSHHGEQKLANGGTNGSNRKRVFTFQKRWLHSLPIMEKTLPESVEGGASMVIKKSALVVHNGDDATCTSSSSPSPSGESARDVIVCMLCDEQNSSHHLMKIWSRLNCRRGRIENHLMSKHPEFMLLLKHKRDSEGELAVQIFLQGMREGRCNIRSEISLGLYNHIQSLNAHVQTSAEAVGIGVGGDAIAGVVHGELLNVHSKRGFPSAHVYTIREGFTGSKQLTMFPPVGTAKATLELLELETRRKRVKLTPPATPSDASGLGGGVPSPTAAAGIVSSKSGTPAGAAIQTDLQVAADASGANTCSLETSALSQWQSVFVNKLVVITGGENEFITRVATNLWLLGANVLLTFTKLAALDDFTASHITRFPETEGSESPHGVMLSMLCSFQTRKQIDEWSRSIGDKFARVDFLINFVDEEEAEEEKVPPQEVPLGKGVGQEDDSGEHLVSSASRLRELCQSICSVCFQSAGTGSILNITTQSDGVRSDMNCDAIETVTKSLALELQPQHVQVNCIRLQRPPGVTDSSDPDAQLDSPSSSHLQVQQTIQEQQNAALLHSMLFLLSPASSAVCGSVLRLQHRASSSSSAPTSVDANEVAAAALATPEVAGVSAEASATTPPAANAVSAASPAEDRHAASQVVL